MKYIIYILLGILVAQIYNEIHSNIQAKKEIMYIEHLQEIQNMFFEDAKLYGVVLCDTLKIRLDDLDGAAGTHIKIIHNKTNEVIEQYITIDRDTYNLLKSVDCAIKVLLYHEFGHAHLNRKDEDVSNAILQTIMQEQLTQQMIIDFCTAEKSYIKELFNRK
jgi:hypothetical protein